MSKKLQDAYLKYVNSNGADFEDLLSVVNNYKEAWVRDRQMNFDKRWQQQRAFYSGDHYVRSSEQLSGYRVRLRENHLNNTVQRIVSIFVQNLPVVRAFPATDSYQDVMNAEATEMFCKSYWRKNQLDLKFGDLIKRGCIFGNGFVYTSFDPDIRGTMSLDSNETQSGDPEVMEFRGDIKTRIESPMMYAFRPGIYSLEDHYDMVRMEPVSKSDMEAKYGQIDSEPVKIYNAQTGVSRFDDETAIKNEYYHKPTSWFPEGLYVCWAGKKLIKANEYPYDDKQLPIDHMCFDTVPDTFWALSPMEQLMDLQEQLNKASSMIIEARNLVARPRVYVTHESGITSQSLSDRPGEIMRGKAAGGKPEFYVPQFNFGEMAAHKGDLRGALGMVSGVTGASRGEIPAATKTALALQLVLEQDRSQFLPIIKRFHGCIQNSMYKALSRAAQYIPENDPRVIKLEGKDGSAKMFHGGMVPNPLDVYLEDTNPLGWTAGGRAESIQNLVSAGLIKDENKALEMLQLNLTDPAYELQKINRQAAQKEIEVMTNGKPLEIGPADVDSIHDEEHSKFIGSFNFRSLPEVVQGIHVAHWQAHKNRMAQSMPPGPGGPGGGVQDIEGNLSAGLAAPVPQGPDVGGGMAA